jgi:hypothetical protein
MADSMKPYSERHPFKFSMMISGAAALIAFVADIRKPDLAVTFIASVLWWVIATCVCTLIFGPFGRFVDRCCELLFKKEKP